MRSQRGLTLIEMMAALFIFAVVTVGIAPLLGASLRGTNLSRSYTIGRDAALQGMERGRGLPYYVAFQSQSRKVDILDMYFPCADPTQVLSGCAGEGTRFYNAGTATFTIVCTTATAVGPSCAVPLPTGYSLTFNARFIRPSGTVVVPPIDYKRNPNTAVGGEGQLDTPPSQLLELEVVATWTLPGDTPRSFALKSLIGDRKFGEVKMAGLSRINYGVQVGTSYVHNVGDTEKSDLTVQAGYAESRIETRLVATAKQNVRGVEIRLRRRPSDTAPTTADLGGTPFTGAVKEITTPPDQTATDVAVTGTSITHPNVVLVPASAVAATGGTTTFGVGVSAASELPAAAGTFDFDTSAAGALGFLWIQNQADLAGNSLLQLRDDRKVFSLTEAGGGLTGTTSALTNPLGATRKVQTTATMQLKLLRMMPVKTTVITGGVADELRNVIMLKNFTATVDCSSTNSASSAATATWSATLSIWRDSSDDGLPNGGFIDVNLSNARGATNLKSILATGTDAGGFPFTGAPYNVPVTGNPLVFDGLTPGTDVYLFKEGLFNGYLTNFDVKPGTTTVSPAVTYASIDGAINLISAPTNPLFLESGLVVSVGALTCEALDKR